MNDVCVDQVKNSSTAVDEIPNDTVRIVPTLTFPITSLAHPRPPPLPSAFRRPAPAAGDHAHPTHACYQRVGNATSPPAPHGRGFAPRVNALHPYAQSC